MNFQNHILNSFLNWSNFKTAFISKNTFNFFFLLSELKKQTSSLLKIGFPFSEQCILFDSGLRLVYQNSLRPPIACDHPEQLGCQNSMRQSVVLQRAGYVVPDQLLLVNLIHLLSHLGTGV